MYKAKIYKIREKSKLTKSRQFQLPILLLIGQANKIKMQTRKDVKDLNIVISNLGPIEKQNSTRNH